MNQLSRRDFLKVTTMSMGGLALGSLVGCGAAPVATGVAAGVAGRAAGATLVAATSRTLSMYLIDFAGAIASAVIASRIDDWLEGLSDETRGCITAPLQRMIDRGFQTFDTPVFEYAGTRFLGAGHVNAYDACGLFVAADGTPLMEGPGLMGVCLMGMVWAAQGYQIGNLLVPLRSYQDEDASFDRSFSNYCYDTPDGTLRLDYQADTAAREGTIRVLARTINGETELDESYRVGYRT